MRYSWSLPPAWHNFLVYLLGHLTPGRPLPSLAAPSPSPLLVPFFSLTCKPWSIPKLSPCSFSLCCIYICSLEVQSCLEALNTCASQTYISRSKLSPKSHPHTSVSYSAYRYLKLKFPRTELLIVPPFLAPPSALPTVFHIPVDVNSVLPLTQTKS